MGIMVVLASPAFATDTTLHDGFKVSPLNTSKWSVLDTGGGSITTKYGSPAALRLYGGSHKRINSKTSFASGTYALARINLNGDYQKFGFQVNASETGGTETGAYFDSYEPAYGGAVDQVMAIVRVCISGSGCTAALKQPIAVSWGQYHVFKVAWMPDAVEFHIDGTLVARYEDPSGGPSMGGSATKPVGVWNDRPGEMLADWVFATPKLVSLDFAEVGSSPTCGSAPANTIIYDLDGITCFGSWGNVYGKVVEFSQEGGVLFSSSIHTTAGGDQEIGIFILNEGPDITFTRPAFESNSTPPGTSVDFDDLGWRGIFGPSTWLALHGHVYLSDITLKHPPKKGVANVHLGLEFDRGAIADRLGINVHVKP